MLPKDRRITQDYHFRRLKKRGTTVRTDFFLMNYLENEFGKSRFGVITTAKIGNAPERNRATRIMREVIRLHLDEIKEGYDFVFVLHRKMTKVKMQIIEDVFINAMEKHKLITLTKS